jgi:hypothetical protein
MKEKFRPQPENPRHNAPEAGSGPLGISPPTPEQSPQGGGSTSPERQPLPGALDILERRAQLYESDLHRRIAGEDSRRKENRARYKEFREKVRQLGNELATLYAEGTDRDRLILDLYMTSTKTYPSNEVNWNHGPDAQKTRQLITRIQEMSDAEIAEELRTARELPKRAQESRYKNTRWYKQYEQRRLQAEQQKSTQEFPPPSKE